MTTFSAALELVLSRDPALVGIVLLSLQVSLSAVCIAGVLGIPMGAALAIWRFPGRQALVILATSLMALPPVVVGLFVYVMFSRAGPLGSYGLLFTPTVMIIAQTLLVLPILVALSRQAILPLAEEYASYLASLDAGPWLRLTTLIWDARFGLVTAVLAGFGRAMAEVGAVLIVGGNIAGVTRVMTTSIALETSKGNLELALALGVILIVLATLINACMHLIAHLGHRFDA